MRLFDLRKEMKETFTQHSLDDVDVDFIVSEVLGIPRTELALVDEITGEDESKIRHFCELRVNENMPIDKMFQRAYFYGLRLKVDDNVLSPRQDSEILVETAIGIINENDYHTMLDLCTGSGALAIAIKKNVPKLSVTASDISAKALKIARFNAKSNDVDINFVRSNMFEKITDKYDIIISNPPYISSDDISELDREVRDFDPHIALDGGDMGLKYYNIIHDNARQHLNENGMLILEIGYEQRRLVTDLFIDFELIDCVKDLNGIDRVLVLKKI